MTDISAPRMDGLFDEMGRVTLAGQDWIVQNIVAGINDRASKVSGAGAGNIAELDADGDLVDSGQSGTIITTSSIVELPRFMALNNTIHQVIAAEVSLDLDKGVIEDTAYFTHDPSGANPEQITFLVSGIYLISYTINFENQNAGGLKGIMRAFAEIDAAALEYSYSYCFYIDPEDFGTLAATFPYEATAGEVLTIQMENKYNVGAWGTGDCDTITDRSWVFIQGVKAKLTA